MRTKLRGWIFESAPPAIITSALPRAMIRAASPIARLEEASPSVIVLLGPLAVDAGSRCGRPACWADT